MEASREDAKGTGSTLARVRTAVLVLALVAAVLTARWSWFGSRGVMHELVGPTMGTSFRVRIDADLSDADLQRVRRSVEERLNRVDRLMSTYDTASEVSRLSRHASTDPFPVSAELIEVLTIARDVGERSGGALDVTVAPLVEAWGFGPGGGLDGPTRPAPSSTELTHLRERVGYDLIQVDQAARAVAKAHPETSIDVSAIAQGYGADAVAAALEDLGLGGFLVDVGGELKAVGTRRDGRPWRVGIERPDDEPGVWGTLSLGNEGIATSGDYRDFHEKDGVLYAHIIDPRTGLPITVRRASVSVVHRSAAVADAWATALTVLGPEEGYEVALREGLAALFVYTLDGGPHTLSTPALGNRFIGPGR
jgi:thiamine biosynthesis lipoprotein